jgi:hypothetical protein
MLKQKRVARADWSTPAPQDRLSPAQAAARLKLIREASLDAQRYVFAFDVQHDHAPALRSVLDEMTAMIASRFGGKNNAAQEQALTAAAVALGTLRAAILPTVAEGDPDYRSAHE